MKLDKIKFTIVIGFISDIVRRQSIDAHDIAVLDDLIDVEVPGPIEHHCYPKNENIEALMKHMAAGTNKLDAIREHRAITGMGLKESEDAVERYWPSKINKDNVAAKLMACFHCDEDRAYDVARQIIEG